MIAELQQERKLNEREPIDWETYRQALIDSGMVRESFERRLDEQRRNNGGMTDAEMAEYLKNGGGGTLGGMFGGPAQGTGLDGILGSAPPPWPPWSAS